MIQQRSAYLTLNVKLPNAVEQQATYTLKPVYTLNALRGFSAVMVVLYHLIAPDAKLDPSYQPALLQYFYDPSNFRVLVFLMISGVVISLNTKSLTLQTVPSYLQRRMLRLYPIYMAALLFTLLCADFRIDLWTMLGHVSFTHVLLTGVMVENSALYTLHYEVVFYLLFIPLSLLNLEPVRVAVFSILLGIAGFFLYRYTQSRLLVSYSIGFSFWVAGNILVRYLNEIKSARPAYSRLLSFLLLLVVVPFFNLFKLLLDKYALKYLGHVLRIRSEDLNAWVQSAFSLSDLAYLPFCFAAVLLFGNREHRYKKQLLWMLQLVPGVAIIYLQVTGALNFEKAVYPAACYLVSWLLLLPGPLLLEKLAAKVISGFIWLGGISYGVYVMHLPLLFLFSRIAYFSGSPASYIFRVFLFVAATFLAAFFLEKRFHPWVLNRLKGAPIGTGVNFRIRKLVLGFSRGGRI